jgi:hypothetical protein
VPLSFIVHTPLYDGLCVTILEMNPNRIAPNNRYRAPRAEIGAEGSMIADEDEDVARILAIWLALSLTIVRLAGGWDLYGEGCNIRNGGTVPAMWVLSMTSLLMFDRV